MSLPAANAAPSLPDAAVLDPPRGYRLLAWLGLAVNALILPAGTMAILALPKWRTINIAVGAGAVLPEIGRAHV